MSNLLGWFDRVLKTKNSAYSIEDIGTKAEVQTLQKKQNNVMIMQLLPKQH